MRIRPILLIALMSTFQLGCKGSGFSGTGTGRKEKPKDKNLDTTASEPAVVTGAYLTCEAGVGGDNENTAFGCAIRSANNDKIISPAPGYAFDFYAKTSLSPNIEPENSSPSEFYQALFLIPLADPDPITFLVKLRNLSTEPTRPHDLPQNPDLIFSATRPKAGASLISPPQFNECKPCQKIKATNVPNDATVHWTFTNDRAVIPPDPTCDSRVFSEPVLTKYIHFKAITCTESGVSSQVVEKIYDPN